MRKVTAQFVELSVFESIVPLVSGYLEAYACQTPEIAREVEFLQLVENIRTPYEVLERRLLQIPADVFAFSCYVWNVGLIARLVRSLASHRPDCQIILGGPQVIDHLTECVSPAHENVVVCNGEGEVVFRDYMLQVLESVRDFSTVSGLSYFRDGQAITTGPPPGVGDLNDIPSPFLGDLFRAGPYRTAVLETNRGCPYKCTFCFWGRGDDCRVRKFDSARIMDELHWIAAHYTMMIILADANWGLLGRDMEFSEHIVALKRTFGVPLAVHFSAAKEQLDRTSKIAATFAAGGVITAQAIGIQTLSPDALVAVGRRGIKTASVRQSQEELARQGVSSFVELIWPLPGETLASFSSTIDQIAGVDVGTIVVYPHLVLNNTEIERRQKELGLETTTGADTAGDYRLVTATACVPNADYRAGMWLILGSQLLYNCRALRHTCRYLHRQGLASYSQVFLAFGAFLREVASAFGDYWTATLNRSAQGEYLVTGELCHMALHAERTALVELLVAFTRGQRWWGPEAIELLFEIDLVDCPLIYSNSPVPAMSRVEPDPWYRWQRLEVRREAERKVRVGIPTTQLDLVTDPSYGLGLPEATAFEVDYVREQLPFMTGKSRQENFHYCQGMIQRPAAILPRWRPYDGFRSPTTG